MVCSARWMSKRTSLKPRRFSVSGRPFMSTISCGMSHQPAPCVTPGSAASPGSRARIAHAAGPTAKAFGSPKLAFACDAAKQSSRSQFRLRASRPRPRPQQSPSGKRLPASGSAPCYESLNMFHVISGMVFVAQQKNRRGKIPAKTSS
jgi:hypothetical protein